MSSVPSASKAGVWGSTQRGSALFSSAPGSGQSAFPAPVGPAGGTAPPRSIWGISPAVPVEDAFSHPSFGSSVLGGTTSSAASIVGGSGVGAPAAIPASSATKSIEHAALQGIPSGSSALDKSGPKYSRDEMIALHKPTALPDYLPLIDGVTTRHSLSPALLDPFDPEEAIRIAKQRSAKTRPAGKAPTTKWGKEFVRPTDHDGPSKHDLEALGELESDVAFFCCLTQTNYSWDVLSAQSAQFDKLKRESAPPVASTTGDLREFGDLDGDLVHEPQPKSSVPAPAPVAPLPPAPIAAPAAPTAPVLGSLFGPSLTLDASSPWGGSLPGLGGLPLGPQPAPAPVPGPTLSTAHWFYRDPQGLTQGPFSTKEMRDWFEAGYFQPALPIRLENGTFTPLSTLFPDASKAFTVFPEQAPSLPQPPPAVNPQAQQVAALKALLEEHKLGVQQIQTMEREMEAMKKLGQDVGAALNHHHAMLTQAQQAGAMDRAMPLQATVAQLYAQLTQLHAELNNKLKSHNQLGSVITRIEADVRTLQAAIANPSPFIPVPSPVLPAPPVTEAAASLAIHQQPASRPIGRPEPARSAIGAPVVVPSPAPAPAPEPVVVREPAKVEAPVVQPAKPSGPSFASVLQANVPKDAIPAPAPTPAPAPAPVVVEPEQPRTSLLELQAQEASRQLGLKAAPAPAPVPVVVVKEKEGNKPITAPAPAPVVVVPSVWSSGSQPRSSPSKTLAEIQKEEAVQTALAEKAAAAARAEAASKPASNSVWGAAASPSKGALSLREIQMREEEQAAVTSSSPYDQQEGGEDMMELGDALKHMLGMPTSRDVKATQPQTTSGPVWAAKEPVKGKASRSLREIQEEEARLEAEQAAAKAAALAAAQANGPAVSGGAWARAASKGVSVPLSEPILSLRSIQAQELASTPAPAPAVSSAAASASAPVSAGVWASKVKPSKPNIVSEPKPEPSSELIWEYAPTPAVVKPVVEKAAPRPSVVMAATSSSAKPAPITAPAAAEKIPQPITSPVIVSVSAKPPVAAASKAAGKSAAPAPAPAPAPVVSHKKSPSGGGASGGADEFGGSGLSPEFAGWCADQLKRITGSDDITLAKFCMTVDDPIEVQQYIYSYIGTSGQAVAFAKEFVKRKADIGADTWVTAKKPAKKKGGK